MRYLELEEILRLHFQVVNDYGGAHGVRDENRVAAVLQAPRQKVFGTEQYTSVYEKAAVHLRNIILDHPFVDGNKRTAVTVTAVFLMRNGIKLTPIPKNLEDFAVEVATSKLGIDEISTWLKANTRKV